MSLFALISNFKMEAEFEVGPKSKVGDLGKLSNFHFGSFSSCHMNFGEKGRKRRRAPCYSRTGEQSACLSHRRRPSRGFPRVDAQLLAWLSPRSCWQVQKPRPRLFKPRAGRRAFLFFLPPPPSILAPPSCTATTERPLPKLATPQAPPFPCAPVGASRSASPHRSWPRDVVLLAHGQSTAGAPPRRGQPSPVSFSLNCLQF
jgi:hypothetical protein